MHLVKKYIVLALAASFFLVPQLVRATSDDHYTVIINQVRGETCCDVGSFEYFKAQQALFLEQEVPATFTLRYDVLADSEYQEAFVSEPNLIEYGGFLEVIPSLATDAAVEYTADDETWYEAQYAFLIGYSQEDRKKLIDTYMEKYYAVFATYPKVTTAWMIDPWSLQYLKEKYGVIVHQITREQYGTDSYALYGGPAHYPYWPSDNWALIPGGLSPSTTMPLIMRQTITDPVSNYGDDSSLSTSQPNDYLQDASKNIEYFSYVFNQAHSQPNQEATFALLGLENSMGQIFQDEFEQQISIVGDWRAEPANQVVLARQYYQLASNQAQPAITVYAGQEFNTESKAWWITTQAYQARVRLDQGSLFISDLRLYDQTFEDPYLENPAQNLGWWIVPFALDGSRFFDQQANPEPNQLALDTLSQRKKDVALPTRIIVAEGSELSDILVEATSDSLVFQQDEQVLLEFNQSGFEVSSVVASHTSNSLINDVIQDLVWRSENGDALWGFARSAIEDKHVFTAFTASSKEELQAQRKKHYPLLFPELTIRPLDAEKTYLYTNNQYAIVGRNPIRLVLFPRDKYNSPTLLEAEPKVVTEPQIDSITLKRQHGNSGMLFMDFENDSPASVKATIISDDFEATQKIYFAPNCKQQLLYCVTHPRRAWWYVRAVVDDRKRAAEADQG